VAGGPDITVVVAEREGVPALAACLEAIEPQRGEAEVLLCAASPVGEIAHRFPWARVLQTPGALVPELWREGIRAAGAPTVLLTIGAMRPAPDWLTRVRARIGDAAAVGGAIEPGEALRLRDWGEYFCRYSRDMLPFAEHDCLDLPGDNASYDRARLADVASSWEDGFWEPDVHRALAAAGARLIHDPAIVVRQGRSAGALAFMRQRLVHGRAFGRQRGVRFGVARNVAGVLAAPVVPFLMTLRVAREVIARGRLRGRLVAALPWTFAFNVAWAIGEARGHLGVLGRR
jgi:hypothetical protein